MKKLLYGLLLAFAIVFMNMAFEKAHENALNTSINRLKKNLAEIGITLEFSKQKFNSQYFWEIAGEIYDAEIYSTVADSVLYFKIPHITFFSKLNLDKTASGKVFLPQNLQGLLDINGTVAEKLKISKRYRLLVEAKNDVVADLLTKNILEGLTTSMDLVLHELKLNIIAKDSPDIEKVFDIEKLAVHNETFQNSSFHLSSSLHNLNIYLGLDAVEKYLPATMSLDDASKNIDMHLNFFSEPEKYKKPPQINYKGEFQTLTKAFDFKITGDHLKKGRGGEKKLNKSNLNFSIRDFDMFMEYCTSIVHGMKKHAEESYNPAKVQEMSSLFKTAIKENSEHSQDDTVTFKIEDQDKATLFNGKPIEEVFAQFIQAAKESN